MSILTIFCEEEMSDQLSVLFFANKSSLQTNLHIELHKTRGALIWNFASINVLSKYLRGGSRTAATSKVEFFVIIVNSWKPSWKNSTLDVATVLDPPLNMIESWLNF